MKSYSAAEAAVMLRVSVPTVKQMVRVGDLEGFKTPGGHLRIRAESLQELQENKPPGAGRQMSPSLQTRRDGLEEMRLEVEKRRLGRDLEALNQEDRRAARERQEQRRARRDERRQDREAQRLEAVRLKQEQERERQRQEAEKRRAVFRSEWLARVPDALPSWLSVFQRRQLFEALEAEINKRGPDDEAVMAQLLVETAAVLIAPWQQQRDDLERRERLIRHVFSSDVPFSRTQSETARAETAIRKALAHVPAGAQDSELRVVAEEAVAPIAASIQRRIDAEAREVQRERFVISSCWEVLSYLAELERDGVLSAEDMVDSTELKEIVRKTLEETLTGDESSADVDNQVREIVDAELDIVEEEEP